MLPGFLLVSDSQWPGRSVWRCPVITLRLLPKRHTESRARRHKRERQSHEASPQFRVHPNGEEWQPSVEQAIRPPPQASTTQWISSTMILVTPVFSSLNLWIVYLKITVD